MKESSPILRVLASPRTALGSVLGILALAAAARDVPQGMDASRVLETFGRGTGPFVVLFGLHRLGESFFLWSALALLALHLVAARLRSPAGTSRANPRRFLPVVLLLPLLPLFQRWIPDPDPLRDPIRLSVREPARSMEPYRVEEGSAYRLPGHDGTTLFGSLSFGPWAATTAPDGSLVVHLPVDDRDVPTFQVAARRPPVMETWRPSLRAVVPFQGVFLATFLVAGSVWVLGMAQAPVSPADRVRKFGVTAAMALTLLGPLWLVPGGPEIPLVARATGTDLWFGALVRSAQDVAPWVGSLPVRLPAPQVLPVFQIALAALSLLALYRVVRPSRSTRTPDWPGRAVGVVLALGGLFLMVLAMRHSPLPLDERSLSPWLEERYLALVPSSWSVLGTSLSARGPWAFSWLALSLHGLVLLALAGGLWSVSGPPRRKGFELPHGPFALALGILALFQALGGLGVPGSLLPEATVPASLLVALLASLAWALSPTGPRQASLAWICLGAASMIQWSLVL